MSDAGSTRAGSNRMDYIDWLRIALTALVMCHHQAIAFGAPGSWYYKVAVPHDILSMVLLTMFVAVNQAFFMSLFFFVSAYFTAASLDKKGSARFLRERLTRLGIPLVVYFFVLNPSLVYIVRRFQGEALSGYGRFMLEQGLDYVGWGPLWFVLTLLLFTVVYLSIAATRKRQGGTGAVIDFPTNKRVGQFILAITLFTYLLRMFFRVGTDVIGLQLAYFPLYIAFFFFGIQANRGAWLRRLDAHQAAFWFRIAIGSILAFPVIVVLGGADDSFSGGLTWQAFVYAAWEPFVCIGISMKLLVVFRERLNRVSRLSAILAASAYAAYIIHPYFVVVATRLARDWPLPPALIFLVTSPFVVATCFFAAHLIRRSPGFNKVL